MDPYVKVKFEGREFKTQVKDEAGKTPFWNCKFELYVRDLHAQIIRFKVKDEDIGKDDDVGDVNVSVSQIVGNDNQEHEFWLDLTWDNGKKPAGRLCVKTVFAWPENGQDEGPATE